MPQGDVIGFRRVRGRVIPIRKKSETPGKKADAILKGAAAGIAQGTATAGAWYAFGKRLAVQRERTARILAKVRKTVIPTVKPAVDIFDYERVDRISKLASKSHYVKRVRIAKLKSILNTQKAILKSTRRFGPAAVAGSSILAGVSTYYMTKDKE